jgi:hypothetical protein
MAQDKFSNSDQLSVEISALSIGNYLQLRERWKASPGPRPADFEGLR